MGRLSGKRLGPTKLSFAWPPGRGVRAYVCVARARSGRPSDDARQVSLV